MLLSFHKSKTSDLLAHRSNIPVLVTRPVENLMGKELINPTLDLSQIPFLPGPTLEFGNVLTYENGLVKYVFLK